MFLLDTLLIGLPMAGLKFVFRQLLAVAEEELSDDAARLRRDILELHDGYNAGLVDEETFAKREAALMARWRALQTKRTPTRGQRVR